MWGGGSLAVSSRHAAVWRGRGGVSVACRGVEGAGRGGFLWHIAGAFLRHVAGWGGALELGRYHNFFDTVRYQNCAGNSILALPVLFV